MSAETTNAKAELRDLIAQLSEDEAAEILTYVHNLIPSAKKALESHDPDSSEDTQPLIVSGRDFMSGTETSNISFSSRLSAEPIRDFDALRSDYWPDDESVDDLVAAVREWRREGGYA